MEIQDGKRSVQGVLPATSHIPIHLAQGQVARQPRETQDVDGGGKAQIAHITISRYSSNQQ